MKHLVIKFWLIYILGFAVISASALMAHETLGKNFPIQVLFLQEVLQIY